MEKFAYKRAHPYKKGTHIKKQSEKKVKSLSSTNKSKCDEVVKFITAVDGTELALFKSGFSPLSNFYPKAAFEIDGKTYNSVQQWIDANKAMYFGDDEALEKILETKSPMYGKIIARQIEADDQLWWKKVYALTKKGIEEKVKQNEDVQKALKSTGDAVIAEANKFFPFWTTGVDINDEAVSDYSQWTGKNMMGKDLDETS